MANKYDKGDDVLATNTNTGLSFIFKCPLNGMCQTLLKLYCIRDLEKGSPTDTFVFKKV